MSIKSRDIWVDRVKLFACIMVVLAHFFQSMVKAQIIATSAFYQWWFERTIYHFPVPLFFLCSGYLYQRYSRVTNAKQWLRNVKKKALALGVPYLFFSVITWLLKNVFSSSVNIQTDGLLHCLFLQPLSPYWYLYVLFLVFAVTPTFTNKRQAAWGLGVAAAMKLASILGVQWFYGFDRLLEHGIWFVCGMGITMMDPEALKRVRPISIICAAAAFLAGSIAAEAFSISSPVFSACLVVLACFAVVSFSVKFDGSGKHSDLFIWVSNYTMPIYLMHTIFAAGFRIVLTKLGVTSALIHITLGLIVSFAGPVIAAWIMKKIRYLDFVLTPGKYIKL